MISVKSERMPTLALYLFSDDIIDFIIVETILRFFRIYIKLATLNTSEEIL